MWAIITILCGISFANPELERQRAVLDTWIKESRPLAYEGLKLNIVSEEGLYLGAVSAAPATSKVDYYYHWIRDSALVMDVIWNLNRKDSTNPEYKRWFENFIQFSIKLQEVSSDTKGGLGEPKFRLRPDPSFAPLEGPYVFSERWGRPQNDGPALQSITLLTYAVDLLVSGSEEQKNWVLEDLYKKIIKRNLDYVSQVWPEESFDLWEETKGDHFYTWAVQRRSLLEGAAFADALGEKHDAEKYRDRAKTMEVVMLDFWNAEKNYIRSLKRYTGGKDNKQRGDRLYLDASVVMGILHSLPRLSKLEVNDELIKPSGDWVLSTLPQLEDKFHRLYMVNQSAGKYGLDLAPAIGRYPEDDYGGREESKHGNPWVITTLAFSEIYFVIYKQFLDQGKIVVNHTNHKFIEAVAKYANYPGPHDGHSGSRIGRGTLLAGSPEFNAVLSGLLVRGDQFLARVREHVLVVDPTTSEVSTRKNWSEQIHCTHHGQMRGAEYLTWNYAAFMTAIWAREAAYAAAAK